MHKRLDIKISFRCNNHCSFCVQGNKRKIYNDMARSQIETILADSKDSYKEVIFTGGEPTIRFDIIDLVRYSKKLGYIVHIQSNGRMFRYKDFCKKMIEAGASLFTISVHGHNAELHDSHTGARGSFAQTICGIKHLLSSGRVVFTNTVITALNYRFLPKIALMLVGLGVVEYRFSFPHILGNALANHSWLIPQKKDIILYLKRGLEIGIRKKKMPKTEAIPYCFLSEYANCASEAIIPETKVFDIKPITNFNQWRREHGKLKGPKCEECKYFKICEGPWREYPEFFGWQEFKPVK
ncbi:MAG: radical SAM protein [Candidatus Omnitrophota bacterium]|nr:radical SAM protein [Candidatus Omnitrophota bacterium]